MRMEVDEFLKVFNTTFDIGQDKKAKELAPVIADYQARNTALSKELAEARQENSRISGNCQECDTQRKLEALKKDEECAQLKAENAELTKHNERLSNEFEWEQRVDNLNADCFQLQAEIRKRKDENGELEEAKDKLKGEMKSVRAYCEKLQLENANLEQEVGELKSWIEKEVAGIKTHPLLVKLVKGTRQVCADPYPDDRPWMCLTVGELRALAKELRA